MAYASVNRRVATEELVDTKDSAQFPQIEGAAENQLEDVAAIDCAPGRPPH